MKRFNKKNLQTKSERTLLYLIKRYLPRNYISAQVAMSAIIIANDTNDREKFNKYYLDYVICDEYGEEPLLVIELDDKTHDDKERQYRDRIKNTIIQEAEIPLLRIRKGDNFEYIIKNEIIPILKKEKNAPIYQTIDKKTNNIKQKENITKENIKKILIEHSLLTYFVCIALTIIWIFIIFIYFNSKINKINTPPKQKTTSIKQWNCENAYLIADFEKKPQHGKKHAKTLNITQS
ncbi:MAG: DUF2726 domain-containing protein [Bacteroidales bacterium]|jgi:very-short-patch-repair endonuclease|nr:DUF2726 domain-containing protein [Bacteroidales bacterium]